MLNNNKDVSIVPEPIGHLAAESQKNPDKTNAAIKELKELTMKVDVAINNPNVRVAGFNEKLLAHKFALPSSPLQLKQLAAYLQNKSFRSV